ncbi:MAG TPA: DEAD/DEAH box helicase family protein [Planctomycetota bacterium]|nr:DEAD/DEAH box helicase family protein [Planctomycetota bacterium]
MTDHVRQIASRLSLRPPQEQSLRLLDEVTQLVPLRKDRDLTEALAAVRAKFPQIEDFEREFPSFCFALATGVGKTRLMGAFVAYLYAVHGVRHFLVLAPNLTIYEKLKRDFDPGFEKYVLKGIGDFATTPPLVITGDDYEGGAAVREDLRVGQQRLIGGAAVHINIFNIAKLSSEMRGGHESRIARVRETMGESYFDYLAGLPDLVLLMDESHRYRAEAGMRALNSLNPVLGLELTATPQEQDGGRVVPFKNVLFSYPLGAAMKDGYVKEPAVATRANFSAAGLEAEEIERIKIGDGVTLHENTKLELDAYSRDKGVPRVKPFLLVVTRDIEHAERVATMLRADAFRGGFYKDKVLTVHSKKTSAERDEVVAELLKVEHPDNPTEIVIHVDMLKEGWDVTNLYTIVPLRAGHSSTLVKQSIGRGLRLPYGRRTGVKAIDRLTVVFHDKFKEIVDAANDPNSELGVQLSEVVIGRDVPEQGRKLVEVQPRYIDIIRGSSADGRTVSSPFSNAAEVRVAEAVMDVIRDYGTRQASTARLADPDVQAEVERLVRERIPPQQLEIPGLGTPVDVAATVKRALQVYVENTIAVPRIVVQPVGDVTRTFKDFDLDLKGFDPPLIDEELLIEHLRTHEKELLAADDEIVQEPRLENHIVRELMDLPEVDYQAHSELLYKLAGQVVAHIRARHGTDENVRRVLLYSRTAIVSLIREQLDRHYEVHATRYEASVPRGFEHLEVQAVTVDAEEQPRDVRQAPPNPGEMRGMIFSGLKRSLYSVQRFQSDPERQFAVLLEDSPDVVKWAKPKDGALKITWSPDGRRDERQYNPDFVVEGTKRCFLVEVKDHKLLEDPDVAAKARAALEWCGHATSHAGTVRGKPWSYVLVPDDRTGAGATLAGLIRAFERRRAETLVPKEGDP